jgi:hypothetical protein
MPAGALVESEPCGPGHPYFATEERTPGTGTVVDSAATRRRKVDDATSRARGHAESPLRREDRGGIGSLNDG